MTFIVKEDQEREDEMTKKVMKSNDKLRTNLLSKLAYQKLWVAPKEKPKTH